MTGTALYRRTVEWSGKNLAPRVHALTLKCWRPHPWMVDAYTGPVGSDQERAILDWCRKAFGREAWPIQGIPGSWHRGGATVFGWTWFGFASEAMMKRFVFRWQATGVRDG